MAAFLRYSTEQEFIGVLEFSVKMAVFRRCSTEQIFTEVFEFSVKMAVCLRCSTQQKFIGALEFRGLMAKSCGRNGRPQEGTAGVDCCRLPPHLIIQMGARASPHRFTINGKVLVREGVSEAAHPTTDTPNGDVCVCVCVCVCV